MAIVTKVHGHANPGQFVGRTLQFFTVTKAAMVQAELDAIVVALELVGTVEVIGAYTDPAGAVNVIMSGVEPTDPATVLTARCAAAVVGTVVTVMAF